MVNITAPHYVQPLTSVIVPITPTESIMPRMLAFTAFALLSTIPLPAQTPLTAHQKNARDVYEELVEINTVDSVGSATKAAQAMAARFQAAGFPMA